MVFFDCSAFWGSFLPAELIIPIPPKIKKKRRIRPERTKIILRKSVTRLLTPHRLVSVSGPPPNTLKKVCPIFI
jgi:hypothetical protein